MTTHGGDDTFIPQHQQQWTTTHRREDGSQPMDYFTQHTNQEDVVVSYDLGRVKRRKMNSGASSPCCETSSMVDPIVVVHLDVLPPVASSSPPGVNKGPGSLLVESNEQNVRVNVVLPSSPPEACKTIWSQIISDPMAPHTSLLCLRSNVEIPQTMDPITDFVAPTARRPLKGASKLQRQQLDHKSVTKDGTPGTALGMEVILDGTNASDLKNSKYPLILTLTSFPFRILHANSAFTTMTGQRNVIGEPFYHLLVQEEGFEQSMANYGMTPLVELHEEYVRLRKSIVVNEQVVDSVTTTGDTATSNINNLLSSTTLSLVHVRSVYKLSSLSSPPTTASAVQKNQGEKNLLCYAIVLEEINLPPGMPHVICIPMDYDDMFSNKATTSDNDY